MPRKINCRVLTVGSGQQHLVFEVAGTSEVVGELRVIAADPGYLPVMAQLFSRWAAGGGSVAPQPAPLDVAIRRAINGGH